MRRRPIKRRIKRLVADRRVILAVLALYFVVAAVIGGPWFALFSGGLVVLAVGALWWVNRDKRIQRLGVVVLVAGLGLTSGGVALGNAPGVLPDEDLPFQPVVPRPSTPIFPQVFPASTPIPTLSPTLSDTSAPESLAPEPTRQTAANDLRSDGDGQETRSAANTPATTTVPPAPVQPARPAPAPPAPVTTAPATTAPVTDSPVTDAPVTDPPATTDPPTTDPPTTDPPVTDAPVADAPVTGLPASDTSATGEAGADTLPTVP